MQAYLGINNDLNFVNLSIFWKDMVNLLFSCVQTKAKHSQAPWGSRIFLMKKKRRGTENLYITKWYMWIVCENNLSYSFFTFFYKKSQFPI